MSADLLLPGYDRWLDDPFQREMDRRAVDEDEEEEDESADEDERIPIACSRCGRDTNFDPVYGDLCFRCCRAENE